MGEAKRRQVAGTFGVNDQNVMRTLTIPRDIIEMGFLGTRDTIKNVERLFEEGRRNQILLVDGYNDDPRSLWDIPEVVNHLMEVTRHSPIAIVIAPSSVKLLLGIKEKENSLWFSNTKHWGEDFIGSQIDWLNERYPMTDEDDKALLSEKPDWKKVSPSGAMNWGLSKLVMDKIKYALAMDAKNELAIFKADARWKRLHPDVK